MFEYSVNLLWDAEAAVWVAASEDIPGLVLESGSFAAPELLELNGSTEKAFPICFRTERYEQVRPNG